MRSRGRRGQSLAWERVGVSVPPAPAVRPPLTEGFDAAAEQLLHRAALVQVEGARHGRRAGRLGHDALREPPSGLGLDPCPGRGRVGVRGGRAGERPVGRNGAGRARPLLGRGGVVGRGHSRVKRSGPGWCNPPVGKRAGPETSGPPSESPEARDSLGMGTSRDSGGWLVLPPHALFPSRPLPGGTCSLRRPALRPSLPPSASLPPQGYFGNPEPEGTSEEFLSGMEGGRNPGVRPAGPPSGLPGRGGGAAAAPRGLPLGRRAERRTFLGRGWGEPCGRRRQREA